jgi:hypothetical protein
VYVVVLVSEHALRVASERVLSLSLRQEDCLVSSVFPSFVDARVFVRRLLNLCISVLESHPFPDAWVVLDLFAVSQLVKVRRGSQ